MSLWEMKSIVTGMGCCQKSMCLDARLHLPSAIKAELLWFGEGIGSWSRGCVIEWLNEA